MTSFLIFNHHSLPFDSKFSAAGAVPEFLHICIKCSKIGLTTILIDEKLDASWYGLLLSDSYYWRDWYSENNRDENKDIIRAFLSIATKQPLFSTEDIDADLYEVDFNGEDLPALRSAAWHKAPLVSLKSQSLWERTPLSVVIKILSDDKIEEHPAQLRNIFSLHTFEALEPELLKEQQDSLQSGLELLRKWGDVFPNLEYCGKTEQQLGNWSHPISILNQVSESLVTLNSFVELWRNNPTTFSYDVLRKHGLNHQVSGESKRVKTDPKLRKCREFFTPEGKKELFESHIKLAYGYRVHFFADTSGKSIYIGYVGPHLPT